MTHWEGHSISSMVFLPNKYITWIYHKETSNKVIEEHSTKEWKKCGNDVRQKKDKVSQNKGDSKKTRSGGSGLNPHPEKGH